MQEVLGTKEFVFRDYVDATLVSQAEIDWFADKPTRDRIQAGTTPAQERRVRRQRAACARERMSNLERELRRNAAEAAKELAATA